MTKISANTTVGDLVSASPGRSRIFEHLGIDYCCGGKNSLDQACQSKGLDTDTVVQMLQAFDEQPTDDDATDWNRHSLDDLIEHIEETHHAYLRTALPRLEMLVNRVATRHGHQYEWLRELKTTFDELASELRDHMEAEEVLVFPTIREIASGEGKPSEEQLEQMEDEHAAAGKALATMRGLSNDYKPPKGACNSFRAMLQGLEELERDMHRHVHKENNILFPRARQVLAT